MDPIQRGRTVKSRLSAPPYNQDELARIVFAHLDASPYQDAISPYTAFSASFSTFSDSIASGDWPAAFQKLFDLEFRSTAHKLDAIKVVVGQWVAHLVSAKDFNGAIECIRENVVPWVPKFAIRLTWMVFDVPVFLTISDVIADVGANCTSEMFVDRYRLSSIFDLAIESEKYNKKPIIVGRNHDVDIFALHCLHALGYADIAQKVSKQMNVSLENEAVAQLRASIAQGEWDEVLTQINSSSLFDSESHQQSARKLILKYAISQLDSIKGIELARKYAKDDHQFVGSLLVDPPQLSQQEFNSQLDCYLDSSAISSSAFVSYVCLSALKYQTMADPYCCEALDSLISRPASHKSSLPTHKAQELCHDGEVWDLSFSPNGQYLASVTKSGTLYVWECRDTGLVQHFKYMDPHNSIQCVECTNEKVLIGHANGRARVIDLDGSMQAYQLYLGRSDFSDVTSCCWCPDGTLFIGTYHGLTRWDGSENIFEKQGLRVLSLSIFESQLIVLSAQFRYEDCTGHTISVFDLETNEQVTEAEIECALTSLAVSSDRMFAANMVPHGIRLWELDSDDERVYDGPIQLQYQIKSTFGGPFDKFLLSGSEDTCIRVYNVTTGKEVCKLMGHTDAVNTVKWSPRDTMIASASDDRYVCIWRPKPERDRSE